MPKKVTATSNSSAAAVLDGEYITVKEGAQLLRISEISLRRWLTLGKVRRYKAGSRTLVRRSEVMGMIRPA